MWDVLITLASFVVTIGILVTVHEFGHFWVARRCGVKVIRFSIGFGKALLSKTDKSGTEFVLACIPLGGYVKMLDAREVEKVPSELSHQEFTQKPLRHRVAIVAAGPIANFLFAIAAYWILFMIGVVQLVPKVGDVVPDSPAFLAEVPDNQGRIVAVDGDPIKSWSHLGVQLVKRLGETGSIRLTIEEGGLQQHYDAPIERWLSDVQDPNPIAALGIKPKFPEKEPVLGHISPDGAASKAGFIEGDKIVEVNQIPITHWMGFVKVVQQSAQQPLEVDVLRENKIVRLELTPDQKITDDGKPYGYAGVGVTSQPIPDDWLYVQQLGPVRALGAGIEKTWQVSTSIIDSLGKLLMGALSVKNLSGPITIAKVAGDQVERGFEAFIGFLAYISIMLGIVNLLPVPALDGGHLAFYLIEGLRGKPVSEPVQQASLSIGFTFLLTVMAIAIFNDFSRL